MMLYVRNKLLMAKLSFTILNSTTSDKITPLFHSVPTMSSSNLIQVLLTSQDLITSSTPPVQTANSKLMLISHLPHKETSDGSVVAVVFSALVWTITWFMTILELSSQQKVFYWPITVGSATTHQSAPRSPQSTAITALIKTLAYLSTKVWLLTSTPESCGLCTWDSMAVTGHQKLTVGENGNGTEVNLSTRDLVDSCLWLNYIKCTTWLSLQCHLKTWLSKCKKDSLKATNQIG